VCRCLDEERLPLALRLTPEGIHRSLGDRGLVGGLGDRLERWAHPGRRFREMLRHGPAVVVPDEALDVCDDVGSESAASDMACSRGRAREREARRSSPLRDAPYAPQADCDHHGWASSSLFARADATGRKPLCVFGENMVERGPGMARDRVPLRRSMNRQILPELAEARPTPTPGSDRAGGPAQLVSGG
jgi:hypothetical protein